MKHEKLFIFILLFFHLNFYSQSSCNNLDFENLIPSTYNGSLSVPGWTLTSGTSTGNAASCNLQNCCNGDAYLVAYNQVVTDPKIGGNYLIQAPFPHKPAFVRIGTDTALGRATKLKKSMLIGSSNELIQIAFLAVLENASASSCCDLPGLTIKFFNSSGPIPCYAYSVTPSSNFCSNNAGVTFTNGLHPNVKYNPWKILSFDLSAYNGQNITLEITVFNGNPGGKMAYAYIDANCGPLALSDANMNELGISGSTVNAFSCGSSTTSLKAPAGFHAYAWGGSGISSNYSVMSPTNHTLPNISTAGTYTFSYQVLPGCPILSKQIIYQNTGSLNLQYNVINSTCTTTLSSINYTVGGLPGTYSIHLYNNFSQFNTQVSSGSYSINTSLYSPGIYSFHVVSSSFNCTKHNTIEIKSPPTYPIFTVGTPSGNSTLSCSNSPIVFTANVQGPVPYSYTWSTSGQTLNGQSVFISQPGFWNVTAWSPVTNCTLSTSFMVNQNTTTPVTSISHSVLTVNCNTSVIQTCTGTASPGPNIASQWYYSNGGTLVPVSSVQGTSNIISLQNPGLYIFTASNTINGCISSKTLTVNSTTGVPTFTLSSTPGFFTGCGSASTLALQVTSVVTSPTIGSGVQYALSMPGSTNAPTFASNSSFSNLSSTGTYTVWVKDVTNNCISFLTPHILQNTLAPQAFYYTNPGANQLTCGLPQVTLTGISNQTNAIISWTIPSSSGPISINQTSVMAQINHTLTNASSNVVSLGIFTVGATNPLNQCSSVTFLNLTQDVRKPLLTPTSSPGIINCNSPDVVLSNVQASAVLNFNLIVTYCWILPINSYSICATQLNSSLPGTHTCIATSAVNDCSVQQTYNVNTNFAPAPVSNAGSQFTLACPPNNTLNFCVSFSSGTLPVSWVFASANYTNTAPNCLNVNAPGIFIAAVQNPTSGCKTFASYEVLDCTVGFDEITNKENFVKIYPNPAHGLININSPTEIKEIEIYDLNGKNIHASVFKSNFNVWQVTTDKLPSGMYFMQIKFADKETLNFKFLRY